ncbi:MAG: hypothetical protein FWD66_01065 [Paludibacter sp.]|nr:hypothetical protein [Paludibacter sp.]
MKKIKQKKLPLQFKKQIDIQGGKLTFGQRIELGKIFQTETNTRIIFNSVFECLHNFTPLAIEVPGLMKYFESIIEGLKYWILIETELLHYEPSSQELEAGIMELGQSLGESGTVISLAKDFSIDPDAILTWEYGKIFGILRANLEQYNFEKKLNKVYERSYKKK